jgi:serine O-acetyltransferase
MSKLLNVIAEIELHKKRVPLPLKLKKLTEDFTEQLFEILFDSEVHTQNSLHNLSITFERMVSLACWNPNDSCKSVWEKYLNELPHILKRLHLDAQSILSGDPASRTLEEIYLSYPGFYAVAIYRLAHPLQLINFPLVPRLMTEFAHSKTGVDIHPGAVIGTSFCMDHATGIVIGETAVIGDHVKIYQGVTLGALSVSKSMSALKRHPTIENHVTIYANATILGGKTVIGKNSTIGGNTWVTASVPENSMVFHSSEIKIKKNVK